MLCNFSLLSWYNSTVVSSTRLASAVSKFLGLQKCHNLLKIGVWGCSFSFLLLGSITSSKSSWLDLIIPLMASFSDPGHWQFYNDVSFIWISSDPILYLFFRWTFWNLNWILLLSGINMLAYYLMEAVFVDFPVLQTSVLCSSLWCFPLLCLKTNAFEQ